MLLGFFGYSYCIFNKKKLVTVLVRAFFLAYFKISVDVLSVFLCLEISWTLNNFFHRAPKNQLICHSHSHPEKAITSETISRIIQKTISPILQPYNIRVAHKPTTTLRHLLTNVKERDYPQKQTGSCLQDHVPRLPSFSHWWDWLLNTRLTEHKRATRNGDANNHIALHHRPQHWLGHCPMLNL